MKKQFPLPTEEELVLELRPWIKGFVSKEYSFLDTPDQEELEQEGCLSLILAGRKLAQKPDRFPNREEYTLYIKAMVRNAIRDCVLKLRSKFCISLFKLRRYLKEQDTSLNEYMTSIGEEYNYSTDFSESLEDVLSQENREKLLGLLSPARKGCKDMSIEECRQLLQDVINKISPDMRKIIINNKS